MSKTLVTLAIVLGASLSACGNAEPGAASSTAAASGSAKSSAAPAASSAAAAPAAKRSAKDRLIGAWQFTDETIDTMLKDMADLKEEDRAKIKESMKKSFYEWGPDGKAGETDDQGKKTERTWEVVKEDGNTLVIKDKRGESVDELTITFESDDKISVVMPEKGKTMTATMTRKK